jgi:hypothetical protein
MRGRQILSWNNIRQQTPYDCFADFERKWVENGLKAKLSKCGFNKAELHFLWHGNKKSGVAVDPAKIAVIEKMSLPESFKELQSFLGLANYFRN